ncbi:MAG: MFS transporter [Alphaproteobacteria bacterium]
MAGRVYHGWLVVVCAFFVAFFGWGLGFYGPGVYLQALRTERGWSVAAISSAITVYYMAGAALILVSAAVYERAGPRVAVIGGAAAMAAGVVGLSRVVEPWQVPLAFVVMAVGWASMSGAAINAIVAPWFDGRRGLAVSLALNGASCGGVVMTPLLVALIGRHGFATAAPIAAAAMLAVLTPLVLAVLRPPRAGEQDRPRATAGADPGPAEPWRIGRIVRRRAFVTNSVPFALGLVAQVGLLTHLVAFLAPRIGADGAGWAVSLTTLAAVVGRVATGFFVDRIDRRRAAAANFVVQIAGMALLVPEGSTATLIAGCVLFGLGVGNLITFPALIVQQEFPRAHFARTVALLVAVNQMAFAFGPGLLGLIRAATGGYGWAIALCILLHAAGAAIVLVRPR